MTKINKLTADKQFKLMKLVEAEFPVRRQTDAEFAVHATEILGFPVTIGNVFGAREALGMEATRSVMSNSALETRVALLEKRLAELEEITNRLRRDSHTHAGSSPKAFS